MPHRWPHRCTDWGPCAWQDISAPWHRNGTNNWDSIAISWTTSAQTSSTTYNNIDISIMMIMMIMISHDHLTWPTRKLRIQVGTWLSSPMPPLVQGITQTTGRSLWSTPSLWRLRAQRQPSQDYTIKILSYLKLSWVSIISFETWHDLKIGEELRLPPYKFLHPVAA